MNATLPRCRIPHPASGILALLHPGPGLARDLNTAALHLGEMCDTGAFEGAMHQTQLEMHGLRMILCRMADEAAEVESEFAKLQQQALRQAEIIARRRWTRWIIR